MTAEAWPYWPTLIRLALALGIGLFIGIERERRRKEAGLRTFAFTALMGGVGGLLDDRFALIALLLVGVLVILLNVETIHTGEGAEITTSAALFVTAFTGVLAGQGHTFTATALGVIIAALLAWKEPLAGFSQALTESEFRSAVLLAILTFVIYPALPEGSLDPWHLVEPRAAWITVILVAALGFANYILLKLYGARGVELTGFLGGLVNSTVTVAELATRVAESRGALAQVAFIGVTLATAAMLVRNTIILALLAPAALPPSLLPLLLMLLGTAVTVWIRHRPAPVTSGTDDQDGDRTGEKTVPALASPFSPMAALRFGAIFLALQIAGTLAQRALGAGGFYAVSFIGGFVSSASAVAAAANLAAAQTLSPLVAAIGAVLASAASVLVNLALVARYAGDRRLTRRLVLVLGTTLVLGAIGAMVQVAMGKM
jgi:uncharacterized membrane protein (DUF4010 family)